jgi:hypothetical protein
LPEGVDVPPAVKTTIMGVRADVRGELSYIAISPSVHPTGKRYEWVNWPWNLDDVPEFELGWITQTSGPTEVAGGRRPHGLTRATVRNIDSYLAKLESVQGSNGSAGLVRAAAICRDAGLPESAAMQKLITWNQGPTVDPSWSMEELGRAITRVYRK